jgi:hypothetical protein
MYNRSLLIYPIILFIFLLTCANTLAQNIEKQVDELKLVAESKAWRVVEAQYTTNFMGKISGKYLVFNSPDLKKKLSLEVQDCYENYSSFEELIKDDVVDFSFKNNHQEHSKGKNYPYNCLVIERVRR